ncbi:unnamed protein product [Protopolystoma xenopodis]|uniref:Uncharacterized protein n=1 Tax=Protopolystoma xenopodis TaxID=117903 RepID=A0A3S4ZP15_9PLAT|nr:unnamed protein product [Protopolystoma xenopodis]
MEDPASPIHGNRSASNILFQITPASSILETTSSNTDLRKTVSEPNLRKNNLRSRIQTKIAFRRQVNRDAWDEATTASSVREVVEEEEENDDDMNEAIFDTATPVRLNSSSDASFLQSCQHGDHLSEAAATLTATLPSSRGVNPSMRIAYQPQAKSQAFQPELVPPGFSADNLSIESRTLGFSTIPNSIKASSSRASLQLRAGHRLFASDDDHSLLLLTLNRQQQQPQEEEYQLGSDRLLRAEASGSSAAKQPRVSAPLVSSTNVSLKEPSARVSRSAAILFNMDENSV